MSPWRFRTPGSCGGRPSPTVRWVPRPTLSGRPRCPIPVPLGSLDPKSSIAGPRAKGPSKSSGSQDPRPPQEHRPHPKPGSKQQLHARDPREHPPPGWSSYIRNRPFPSTALDSDRTSGPRVSLSLITELHSAWGRMTAMWARGHLPPSDLWPLGQVGPSLELWPSWS